MSAEPDWVTPEGRLRWFCEHGEQTWLPSPQVDAAFVLDALDAARAERDVARAERDAARAARADLRRQVAALADWMADAEEMSRTYDRSDLAAAAVILLGGVATAVTVLTLTAVLVGTLG